MPDISMCAAECELSTECYRHQDSGTKPNPHWQSYMTREVTGDECTSFLSRGDVKTIEIALSEDESGDDDVSEDEYEFEQLKY